MAGPTMEKTMMCSLYGFGQCKKSSMECPFAHDKSELTASPAPSQSVSSPPVKVIPPRQNNIIPPRPPATMQPTPPAGKQPRQKCSLFSMGACKKGADCPFSHGDDDTRPLPAAPAAPAAPLQEETRAGPLIQGQNAIQRQMRSSPYPVITPVISGAPAVYDPSAQFQYGAAPLQPAGPMMTGARAAHAAQMQAQAAQAQQMAAAAAAGAAPMSQLERQQMLRQFLDQSRQAMEMQRQQALMEEQMRQQKLLEEQEQQRLAQLQKQQEEQQRQMEEQQRQQELQRQQEELKRREELQRQQEELQRQQQQQQQQQESQDSQQKSQVMISTAPAGLNFTNVHSLRGAEALHMTQEQQKGKTLSQQILAMEPSLGPAREMSQEEKKEANERDRAIMREEQRRQIASGAVPRLETITGFYERRKPKMQTMCKYYEQGFGCIQGDSCEWAHSQEEVDSADKPWQCVFCGFRNSNRNTICGGKGEYGVTPGCKKHINQHHREMRRKNMYGDRGGHQSTPGSPAAHYAGGAPSMPQPQEQPAAPSGGSQQSLFL